jgi:hypothetical protein
VRKTILLAACVCALLGACASSGSDAAPAPDETSSPRRSSGGAADPGGREVDGGDDDAEIATACFSSPDAVLVRDLEPRRAPVSTMFVAGSRLVVGSDQELASFPFTGGRSGPTRARSTSPLPTVSGDRVYYVDGISLYWTTPVMDMPVSVAALWRGASGLHVDDQYVYISRRVSQTEGILSRTPRDGAIDVEPTDIARGLVTPWIGGTPDKVLVVTHQDDGATSVGGVYGLPKPNADMLLDTYAFDAGKPVGFVVDGSGVVLALQGAYGGTHRVASFYADGTHQVVQSLPPASSIDDVIADAGSVFYIADRRRVVRVPRAGGEGQPRTLAQTPSRCVVSAIADGGAFLYVSVKVPSASPRVEQIWRVAK